jgi:hypothetical protein
MPLSDEPYISHRQNLDLVDYKCHVVNDDFNNLNPEQKILIKYFENVTEGLRLANRADLKPAEITSYLPNIILFDLKYDLNNNIDDIIVRLVGTAAAEFYGEYTGYSLFDQIFDKSLSEARDRLVKEAKIIIEEKKPIITHTEQSIVGSHNISVNTLKIPFAKNGKDIDMIFMYLQVSSSSR